MLGAQTPMTHIRITEITVSHIPETDPEHHAFAITVAWRGGDQYAVYRYGECLSADGTWDYESRPSAREDDWLATYRFDQATALSLAVAHAPTVQVNGIMARDLEAWRAARPGAFRVCPHNRRPNQCADCEEGAWKPEPGEAQ